MKVICVDDERILVEDIARMCMELNEIDDVQSFVKAGDALAWIENNPIDLALLDIDMPGMNGIDLAAAIKKKRPDVAIVFLTAYSQYALDAFSVHASGYLMKPITRKALEAEVSYALSKKKKRLTGHIVIKTFDHFDVYVDDQPIGFKLAKAKEILAYLVDKQGNGVTRADLFAAVWEDRPYDRKMQKQLDVYIRSLRQTLKDHGISEIMEMDRGVLRVRPDSFICDLYLFLSGDSETMHTYRGKYMSPYSWASLTESTLFWQIKDQDGTGK